MIFVFFSITSAATTTSSFFSSGFFSSFFLGGYFLLFVPCKILISEGSTSGGASFLHLFTVCHATPTSSAAFLTPISFTRARTAALSIFCSGFFSSASLASAFSSVSTTGASVFLAFRPLFFSSVGLASAGTVAVATVGLSSPGATAGSSASFVISPIILVSGPVTTGASSISQASSTPYTSQILAIVFFPGFCLPLSYRLADVGEMPSDLANADMVRLFWVLSSLMRSFSMVGSPLSWFYFTVFWLLPNIEYRKSLPHKVKIHHIELSNNCVFGERYIFRREKASCTEK